MNSEQTSKRYIAKELIGKGTFGDVYIGIDKDTGEIVAIKQTVEDRRYKNRELEIFKSLSHPNIVRLHCWFSTKHHNNNYMNLVMDYHSSSLADFLYESRRRRTSVDLFTIKLMSYSLLRGIAYVHAKNIGHRDIKPHNLLVNNQTKEIILCDFGSAKIMNNGPNIAYICSRYYRAPELIFGATEYTTAIDIWSVGCVIGEIMIGNVLFGGENNASQLIAIIKMIGTPTREEVRAMNPSYTGYKFPHVNVFPLSKIFVPEIVGLLRKFLVYDPTKRITALDAMKDSFFDELRDKSQSLTHLFNWTDEELALHPPEYIKELTPQ